MQYKLINIETKEKFICEKVEVDGFEYYVYNEKSAFVKGAMFITVDNIIHSNYGYNYLDRVIVASNNSTLNISQVVDEVEEMAKDYENSGNSQYFTKYDFKEGYNKAKEQYTYNKQDMIEFARFTMLNNNTTDKVDTFEECIELFEQSRLKTIYFK